MLDFDKLIRAELIWDGGDEVRIPSGFEAPSANQMQGTTHDRLGEIACRICYSEDTEVLTRRGWINFPELIHGEEVATYNRKSGCMEYQVPNEYIEYVYTGSMYVVENTKISLRVTSNHNLWAAQKFEGKYDWGLYAADGLLNRKYKIQRYALYKGSDIESIVFPGHEYQVPDANSSGRTGTCHTRVVTGVCLTGAVKLTAWARFLGYYISEGSINNRKTVVIYQKPETIGPIVQTIRDLGFTPSKVYIDKRNGVGRIALGCSVIARYLEKLGMMAGEKRLPNEIFEWPLWMRSELLNALMFGDGSKTLPSRVYHTSSEQLADDVQRLIIQSGRPASISHSSGMFRVRETLHDLHTVNYHCIQDCLEEVNGEKVYCVSVPNMVLMIRRDEKVILCGNCYDSMGVDSHTGKQKGRSSAQLHTHILEVKNHNVYEHADFTVRIEKISHDALLHCFINRPGVWCESTSEGFEVSMNHRCVLEWDEWEPSFAKSYGFMLRSLGCQLWEHARKLAPQIYPESRSLLREECRLVSKTEHLLPTQASISLYLSFSRGAGNEQCRHRFRMSQRSTRFVDESESPYVRHPLISQFLLDDTVDGSIKQDALARIQVSETNDKSTYDQLVTCLQDYLKKKGVDGIQARKQARGAARGYLGLALQTEMIFTASIGAWRWMLSQRGTKLADAEIRILYTT